MKAMRLGNGTWNVWDGVFDVADNVDVHDVHVDVTDVTLNREWCFVFFLQHESRTQSLSSLSHWRHRNLSL